MKIYALRGLTNFVRETEIAKLLVSFNLQLAKRQVTTPYSYQEYELIRGKNALPFLVEKFGYSCFKETMDQLNKQYAAMPEAFQGHFTTDDEGEMVTLRNPEEAKRMMEKFWDSKRNKFFN